MSDEVLYTCPHSINPHPDCDHPQRTTGDILRPDSRERERAMATQGYTEDDIAQAARQGYTFEPLDVALTLDDSLSVYDSAHGPRQTVFEGHSAPPNEPQREWPRRFEHPESAEPMRRRRRMSERISRAILVGLATVGLLSLIAAALGETLHLTTMLVVLVAMTLAQCLLP